MLKQELYINDIPVDIDKDVSIYPVFQSPFVTDLQSIISHRTNNISLPITPNNAKAIQMYHLADTTDVQYSYPRDWNTVRYYRNGFNICNEGQGMVTGISGGRINFTFTWGASSKLQRLKNRKLSDLLLAQVDWTDAKFGWCENLVNKCGYFKIDYGMGTSNFNFIHPCVTTNYLLQEIEINNQIEIDKTKLNKNYLIPCILRPVEQLTSHPSKFSLRKGVPNITQADFLKGLMQIFGLFAYLKDDETIGFMSFKDVYESKNFFDWTDKVITSTNAFNSPESLEFKLDGFAQINTFQYTSDKDAEENDDYNSSISVHNTTIEKSKEVVKSPFNYSKLIDKQLTINVYTKKEKESGNEDENESSEIEVDTINKDLKPRIIKLGSNNTADFPEELKWSNILSNPNYEAYINVVKSPRVLKLKCLLTDWDIAHINFSFPVYFRQYGHFYAIIKIQTKAGGVCDCSFLEIK